MWFLSAAIAGPTLGAFVGVHAPSVRHELFVPANGHEPLGLALGGGIRAGWATRYIFGEVEAFGGPTLKRSGLLARGSGHLGFTPLQKTVVQPFALIGVGAMFAADDLDRTGYAGVGSRFDLPGRVDLRFDARALLASAQGPGRTLHGELFFGVDVRFGGSQNDTDGDGIPDGRDQCKHNAELANGLSLIHI